METNGVVRDLNKLELCKRGQMRPAGRLAVRSLMG